MQPDWHPSCHTSRPMKHGHDFERREPGADTTFEEGYWGVVVDPDGRRRDLSQEREKKLGDLADELASINELPA